MIAASLLRSSWMFPHLAMPAFGPPWELRSVAVPSASVIVSLWLACLAGAVGVAAGLLAVQRGARPPVAVLLIGALAAVATLTVLPPVGSSDALDYATYGRIAVLGHSPYVMTPFHLRHAHNAFALSVPRKWQHQVSVYGPLATAEQFLAARLGGTSMARITFWLKFWNSIAFGAVALVIDRLLRSDPAQRLRAHLLWTVNPLLLWDLIASGHLDLLAAAAGLLGLLTVVPRSGESRPPLPRALAAGALIGVAADIKVNYLLFAVGLAWALRRSAAALSVAAAGAVAMLVSGYAWFGRPALRAVLNRRNTISADDFYLHLVGYNRHDLTHIALIAAGLFVLVAILMLWRMPTGGPAIPAIRPALAVSAAWVFFWPYQLPWYDAMIICLLVLYPASWFDWLVLMRLAAGTISNIPGNPWSPANHVVAYIEYEIVGRVAPLFLFLAAVGLVVLCLSGRWKPSEPVAPPGASGPGPSVLRGAREGQSAGPGSPSPVASPASSPGSSPASASSVANESSGMPPMGPEQARR